MNSLEQMLEDCRNGEREFPSYEELVALVAPQVAADERAAFEVAVSKIDRAEHLERYSEQRAAWNNEQFPSPQFTPVAAGDYRMTSVQFAWRMWQAGAVIATNPVQAQEPVAYIWSVNGMVKTGGDSVFDDHEKFYRSPVQPVAVPGDELPTDPLGCTGYLAGMAFGNCPADEISHCVSIITAALAAPAAQGDSVKLECCGSTEFCDRAASAAQGNAKEPSC